jgi:DNA polymerase-3 subunit delta
MAKSKPTPTFYIFHGDDLFALEEEVGRMHDRMGDATTAELNTATFEGKSAAISDVFNAVSALPFLSDKRLVIVSGWLAWLSRSGAGKSGKETLEAIAAQALELPDFARLVFVERETIKESNPVLKAARSDPRGYIKTFRQPKNLPDWIKTRAAFYSVEIEPPAVHALAAIFEDKNNLIAVDNELFKLAAYVGDGRPIHQSDVAALTTYVPEEKVFDMVDALGKRDGQTAARLLHSLLKNERDKSGALGLFSMIVRQFRMLIQAREHLDNGGGRGGSLAQALHVHSFVATKLEKQSRNFSLEDLEEVYRHLLDIDRRIKTGKIDPVLALDMLVAGLSS